MPLASVRQPRTLKTAPRMAWRNPTCSTIRFDDTPSFARYPYPSALPQEVKTRMDEGSRRRGRALGYDDATFNIELFWGPARSETELLDKAPREGSVSGSATRGSGARRRTHLEVHGLHPESAVWPSLHRLPPSMRRFLILAASVVLGCTYGPEERRATVVQVVRLGDSFRALAVVRMDAFRSPTGLAAFPDGGKRRFLERRCATYLIDARRLEARLLAQHGAPDELWESFGAWIAGLEGDDVAYLRLTGCPRGGECHPALRRSVVYRLSLEGEVTPVDSVPPNAGLPGVRVTRRPGEQSYVRFGRQRDTVVARFEESEEPRPLFAADADGSLVPLKR